MLGVSGTTQYINPDYIQPLPTSLDTKNSPLALLAQTCSSIGKDNSPSSVPSSSSSSSSLLSSSSSSCSSSKLNQHQQIHSSSSSSSSSLDKKESKNLQNGKDQSSRLKSDSSIDHNGAHHHHTHHHHSGGYGQNSYKMSSSGKSGYSDRLSKENGRSSAGRLSVSPPKHKLSSSNGYGMNGNKNHLSKSDAGASYRSAMQSYYGNGKEDYISSLHHHQPSSKLSPSSAASPLQSLKMQQELFNAAFGMGYPPWLMGQSPFMPTTFDPFFLSAAALSSQHKQHLLQLHQQLFSSLSGYPHPEAGGSSGSLGTGGHSSGSSHKHDTDAGVSPTSKSSASSHSSSTGPNSLHSNSSSLFPLPAYAASHIPGHSSSQGQQLSPSSHPYACNWLQPGSDFCGKRFSTYEELLEHLKSHVAQGSSSEEGRLFPPSFFPFMFGMAPPFALPPGYNSNYLLQQQQQQQAAAASLFQRSYSPSPPSSSSSSSSLSSTSTHLNSRYHPYNKPPISSGSSSLSSPSIFPSLMPFPTPTSSSVVSPFSSLMPPFGYGFPYPMFGGQKLSETAAGP